MKAVMSKIIARIGIAVTLLLTAAAASGCASTLPDGMPSNIL
jgi:hypothetical protein